MTDDSRFMTTVNWFHQTESSNVSRQTSVVSQLSSYWTISPKSFPFSIL